MLPVFLFNLASRQLKHLAARQAVISGNIANVNTPGYRAQDVTPFREVLDKTTLAMASTNPGHLGIGASADRVGKSRNAEAWEVVHSGNSVSVEEQLLKAGEVARDQSLNTGVVKSFNRMFAASVKGGQ